MNGLPRKLQEKLNKRKDEGSLRSLGTSHNLVDFSSNDYLGFAFSEDLHDRANRILESGNFKQNGATGSRLLTGNHEWYEIVEKQIADFHEVESALIFNSGYDANVGIFECIPQRGDSILYDELCHASIRDGIRMSHAKGYKFTHNQLTDLEQLCRKERERLGGNSSIYVVTESVFSMDGDQPDLKTMIDICKKYDAHLIVDEAHALGVIGKEGRGLVQELQIQDEVFIRIVTFGKAMGCHGSAVLSSGQLRTYLVNFARSFVYTTGLSPHSVAMIGAAYQTLKSNIDSIQLLHHNIAILLNEIKDSGLSAHFVSSDSPIHSMILPGNLKVKEAASRLQKEGFDLKPILSPTVPKGQERLRICLHSYNSEADIRKLVQLLAIFVA